MGKEVFKLNFSEEMTWMLQYIDTECASNLGFINIFLWLSYGRMWCGLKIKVILESSGEWSFHLSVTYKPSHCLLHISPWSHSEGVYLTSCIAGSQVVRWKLAIVNIVTRFTGTIIGSLLKSRNSHAVHISDAKFCSDLQVQLFACFF